MASSSPSPPSSSTDSQSSYSPRMMSTDLMLDPTDPLNFLLSPMDDQMATMWPETQMKPYGDMDFSDLSNLSMDMDYMNAIAVEPSALHFNNFNPHFGFDAQAQLLASQFPFTFQPANDPSSPSASDSSSTQSSSSVRRLSISSSVSSSGASMSPAPESISSPPIANSVPVIAQQPSTAQDPAALLAERVRQSAGVMLALPMTAQLQAFENKPPAEQTAPTSPTSIPKLPIPRLPRPSTQSAHSATSSAASTPPPTTPSPPPSSAASTPPSVPTAPPSRPKTSHTTIERRYRTNLNARIQSLRMAVPALRVVDDRSSDGSKKRAPNKVLVSGDLALKAGEDVVDERGYIDGVKVARKCSKANVLGKAVEYIRVLKRRETRLKAEQAGLKSLVSGLVGGPALLKEWEREWKEMFGGEEKDEVSEENEAEAEDDDSEDDGDEEEEGRKRKRGKTTPSPSDGSTQVKQEKKEKKVALAPDGTVPEKRKRGRPRKVVPPPVSAPLPGPVEQAQMQPQGSQSYLLATFALFSFFNSPLTSSSLSTPPTHVHTGIVLNGSTVPLPTESSGAWSFGYYVQVFHLLVSILVLLSFLSNWAGFKFGPTSLFADHSSSTTFNFSALKPTVPESKERKTLEDWVRLGESYLLPESSGPATPTQAQPQPRTPASVSALSRLQVYYNTTSRAAASASDLCTAALTLHGCGTVLGGLARARARSAWSSASASSKALTVHERLVLETLSVDDAAQRLVSAHSSPFYSYDSEDDDGERATPIRVLAATLVRERVRAHLGSLFVGNVRLTSGDAEREDTGVDVDADAEERENEEKERRRTIEAAKELGGSVGELGRRLERLWKVPDAAKVEVISDSETAYEEGEPDEVEALATVFVLYRKVFSATKAQGCVGDGSSTLMSPPPSPGKNEQDSMCDVARLRRALGSRAFEESEALEDARDRVVDMVVDLERRRVGL
ncbi:hypothetical protein H0H92_011321 [Tricholoma furcatifolium]|nr:hypothetical protein H0H92_011321 [Tricholoma furcatifolium]